MLAEAEERNDVYAGARRTSNLLGWGGRVRRVGCRARRRSACARQGQLMDDGAIRRDGPRATSSRPIAARTAGISACVRGGVGGVFRVPGSVSVLAFNRADVPRMYGGCAVDERTDDAVVS